MRYLVILITLPCFAAITNLTVVGTTPTQATITYTAPNTSACTFEVSESATYSPVIADVDATLFTGANSDARAGSLGVGTTGRTIVVGTRTAAVALDGRTYSRTMEPNTVHYFRIICGVDTATGTFTTANLPYGNTNPEPVTSAPNPPGTYPWPTIDSMTGSTHDPQTGVKMWPFALNVSNWPSGATTQFSSETLIADNLGVVGYPTFIDGTFYWINPTTSEVRNIGIPGFAFGNYGGDTLFTEVPIGSASIPMTTGGTFYAMGARSSDNKPAIMSAPYPGTWQAGSLPALTWTNRTPIGSGLGLLDLATSFDANFNQTFFNNSQPGFIGMRGMTGDQTKVFLQSVSYQQDSLGWMFIFDPGSNLVTAAMPTWTPTECRWCKLHSSQVVQGSPNYLAFEPASGTYSPSEYHGGPNNGQGPWYAPSATTLTTSPAFAAGAAITGFGGLNCTAMSAGCDIITVSAGSPCDPDPGPQEPHNCGFNGAFYHLMNAAVGDHIQPDQPVADGNEVMVILGISGNNWAVQRAFIGSLQNHAAANYWMLCSLNGVASLAVWDFVADPHGTGTGIQADTVGHFDHGSYSQTNAGGGDTNGQVLNLLTGATPAVYLNQALTATPLLDPSFAGVRPQNLVQWVESYTASGAINPTVSNANFVIENRPHEVTNNITYTAITGQLYKLTITSGGGNGTYDPKKLSGITAVGGGSTFTRPLLDVSGPASNLGTTGADSYKVCYTFANGECHAGSVAGEWYVNVPSASQMCDRNVVTSMCVAPLSALAQHVIQVRWDDAKAWRPVTSCFRPFGNGQSYWNARMLPSGTHLICYADVTSSTGNVFLVRLPPTTTPDGVDRTTFVSKTITIPAGPGETATAVVKFGYAENGAASAFNCTPRADPCVAFATTVGSNPFKFASEGYTGPACVAGCNIDIPVLPNHTAYYQIVYVDAMSMETLGTAGVTGDFGAAPPAVTLRSMVGVTSAKGVSKVH